MTAPDPTTYFVAVNGHGDRSLWQHTDDPERPREVAILLAEEADVFAALSQQLADLTAERDEWRSMYEAIQPDWEQWVRRAEAVQQTAAAQAEVIADVAAVVPKECWIHRTLATSLSCIDLVGATFPNGAPFPTEACCMPCRLRAALAPVTTDETEGGDVK